MAKDALNGRRIRARHHEQRRGRVAQVVEADLPHQRPRPELHLALRATPQVGVLRHLGMPASLPSADVAVAGHDPGAGERRLQQFLERRLLGHHRAVLVWEDQLGRGLFDGGFEVRHQFGGDGHRLRVPALGGVARVRAANANEPPREIHVGLPQPEQLALAQPGVDGRGEEWPPAPGEREQDARNLLQGQERWEALGHAPTFHVEDRILGDLAGAPGGAEGATEEAAQVVHCLGSQLARLRLDELLHPARRHFAY
ncbi:MAG: hypothetical protein WBV96_24795 [Polyangia bacterium]